MRLKLPQHCSVGSCAREIGVDCSAVVQIRVDTWRTLTTPPKIRGEKWSVLTPQRRHLLLANTRRYTPRISARLVQWIRLDRLRGSTCARSSRRSWRGLSAKSGKSRWTCGRTRRSRSRKLTHETWRFHRESHTRALGSTRKARRWASCSLGCPCAKVKLSRDRRRQRREHRRRPPRKDARISGAGFALLALDLGRHSPRIPARLCVVVEGPRSNRDPLCPARLRDEGPRPKQSPLDVFFLLLSRHCDARWLDVRRLNTASV